MNGCIQRERGRYAAYTPAGKYGALGEITGVLSDPGQEVVEAHSIGLGGVRVKTLTYHEE